MASLELRRPTTWLRWPSVLDRAILRELLIPFGLGSLAFLCLLLTIDTLHDLVKLAVAAKLSFGESAHIFMCRVPKMVVLTLPMASLLAVVQGHSRLSRDGEITAMRAAGISIQRIGIVGLTFSILVACLAFVLTEAEGIVFRIPTEGTIRSVVMVQEFDYRRAVMKKIGVIEFKQGAPVAVYTAQTGTWREGVWELQDVEYTSGSDPAAPVTENVKILAPAEESPAPRDIVGTPKHKTEMNRQELRRRGERNLEHIDALRRAGLDTDHAIRHGRDLAMQYHLRLAVPVACIAFALVGMPLGINSRRVSSSMNFGLAAVIVLGYYIFFDLISALGQSGILHPFVTAWLPAATAIATGVVLCWRVAK